jgi:nicotinamidase-related amidase
MTSAPVRDQIADHLITPENAALLLIDYQPAQLAGVRSMDHALLLKNAVSTVKTIKTFGVPVVHSTVNVAAGRGQPTLFTALDALREGYEVYPVVDAIGGTSPEAHRAGLDRVIQAGGQPISWVSLACELQRDWARQDTVEAIIEIVLTDRLLKEQ